MGGRLSPRLCPVRVSCWAGLSHTGGLAGLQWVAAPASTRKQPRPPHRPLLSNAPRRTAHASSPCPFPLWIWAPAPCASRCGAAASSAFWTRLPSVSGSDFCSWPELLSWPAVPTARCAALGSLVTRLACLTLLLQAITYNPCHWLAVIRGLPASYCSHASLVSLGARLGPPREQLASVGSGMPRAYPLSPPPAGSPSVPERTVSEAGTQGASLVSELCHIYKDKLKYYSKRPKII